MPDGFKEWLGAAALVISLLTSVYAWLTSKAKANSEHLISVDKKLTDHDRRIQFVESEIHHLPSKDDVNELKLAIADVRGEMGQLGADVRSISNTIGRIDRYLENGNS